MASASKESGPLVNESKGEHDTTERNNEPVEDANMKSSAMLSEPPSPGIIIGSAPQIQQIDETPASSTEVVSTLPHTTKNIQLQPKRHPYGWNSTEVLEWFQLHQLDELYNSLFGSGEIDGQAFAEICNLRLKNYDSYKDQYARHINASQKNLLKDFDRFGQLLKTDFADKYKHRFDVAFSFPGDKRDEVSQIADKLCAKINKKKGEQRIFYDKYHEAELARPNLDLYLQSIYRYQTRLIVVFMCDEYGRREWCGLESRAIRSLLKQQQDDRIMLLTFDGSTIDGVSDIDGYLNISGKSPDYVVDAIYKRLQDLGEPLPPSQSILPQPIPPKSMKSKIIMIGKNAFHPLLPWFIIIGLFSYILGTLIGR